MCKRITPRVPLRVWVSVGGWGAGLLVMLVLAAVVQGQTAREIEDVFWWEVVCEDEREVQAYLKEYPSGAYVAEARACLAAVAQRAAAEARLDLDQQARIWVQRGLTVLNHPMGAADGLFDPATRTALRQWQRAEGVAVTGYLTPAQAATLIAAGREAATRRAQEAERRRQAREAEQRRAEEAERQRQTREAERRRAEEAERQRQIREAAARQAREAEQRRAQEAERQRQTREAAARQAEEAERRRAEEAERQRQIREAAARQAEEAERRRAEEAERQRQIREAAARQAEEAERQRQTREAAARQAEEAERQRQTREAAARQAEEAERQRQTREAAARQAREAEQRRAQEAERQREANELVNTIGMEFVRIEVGTFRMGAPARRAGRSDDRSRYTIHISQPFYLGKYEVTQGQWRAVLGDNPSHFTDCGDTCPVENVSWEDAQAFIEELNLREGIRVYRLPTEAEWEYATRAGTRTVYSFGNTKSQLRAYGWYRDNSDNTTHPVRGKRPNGWGLYDLHGNVWEWVADWYGDYPSGRVTDPQGPSSGTHRVIRGGGWRYNARDCRTASRGIGMPGFRSSYVGFRLARTP